MTDQEKAAYERGWREGVNTALQLVVRDLKAHGPTAEMFVKLVERLKGGGDA